MRIPGCLQAFFALPSVLGPEVGYKGKTIDRKSLAPDSLVYLVLTTFPMGFSWTMFLCQDVTDHCTLAGSADSSLVVCGDHSTPPLLSNKHGIASGSADVLGFEVSPANAYCSGAGKRIPRFRSVARTVSSRRRIGGRAVELVNGHESFLPPINRGALSIPGARIKFARLSLRRAMVNCAHGTKSIWETKLCLFRSDWSLRWLDSASVRMHRTRASRSRFVKDGCRELASEVGRVSVFQSGQGSREVLVHPCQVACAPLYRARSLLGVFKFGRR